MTCTVGLCGAIALALSLHYMYFDILACTVGLRGAIAFSLSLHLEFEQEKRYVLVTATLIIVLFTVIFLGGMTLPIMKVTTTDKLL